MKTQKILLVNAIKNTCVNALLDILLILIDFNIQMVN